MLKHKIEKDHMIVGQENFKIIVKNFRNMKWKQMISDTLLMKNLHPLLTYKTNQKWTNTRLNLQERYLNTVSLSIPVSLFGKFGPVFICSVGTFCNRDFI